MLILGIDPGKNGALAFLSVDAVKTKRLELVWDMPEDPADIASHVSHNRALIAFAVIEDVGGGVYTDKHGERRGQGSAASFAFGKNVGVLHGILIANEIPVRVVKPAVWKALMGVSSDKSTSLAKARALFPEKEHDFRLKKHDGRAEAALLAHFGAERFTKSLSE